MEASDEKGLIPKWHSVVNCVPISAVNIALASCEGGKRMGSTWAVWLSSANSLGIPRPEIKGIIVL